MIDQSWKIVRKNILELNFCKESFGSTPLFWSIMSINHKVGRFKYLWLDHYIHSDGFLKRNASYCTCYMKIYFDCYWWRYFVSKPIQLKFPNVILFNTQLCAITGGCGSKPYDGGWKYGMDKQWCCNCAWASKWKDSLEVSKYKCSDSSFKLKISRYYCRHFDAYMGEEGINGLCTACFD